MNRRKKKISVYVCNEQIAPSGYYRVIQYIRHLDGNFNVRNLSSTSVYHWYHRIKANNKLVWLMQSAIFYLVMITRATVFLVMDLINKPDYVIVSRSIATRYIPFITRFLLKQVVKKSTLIWDFDDHIFKSREIHPKETQILGAFSEKIIVTHSYLRDQLPNEWKDKTIILPTTDGDMQGFSLAQLNKQRKKGFEKTIELVWVATVSNIPHLLRIIEDLDRAAQRIKKEQNKNLELKVICSKPIEVRTKDLKINNIIWTREKAIQEIYNSHIGLMPLTYDEFTLGKGGFKLIQYMSTGLPVIASAVGFNTEVVTPSSGILIEDQDQTSGWIDAVLEMSQTEEKWNTYSEEAYKRWQEAFSFEHNLKVWQEVLGLKE